MRPRLLDLFCGAGGAATGYYRAGFDVVGVDINPQPRFPFLFVQADATTYQLRGDMLGGEPFRFDVVHASPPCQAHTTMSNRWRGKDTKADTHVDLIALMRAKLKDFGAPWVIENVAGARKVMRNPITLDGSMFGLGVHRPRLFESNVALLAPPKRSRVLDPIGVYGKHHDGRRLFNRKDGTIQYAAESLEEGRGAMGIDWMEWRELAESIPPAYTEYIGRQLIAVLEARKS